MEAYEGALFAQYGDDLVNAGTHGAARQRNANRLGELAHLQPMFLERRGKFSLNSLFAEVVQGRKSVD